MGEPVSIHQAKTHLSRLITRVEGGEEVVITRHGKPVARLTPVVRATGDRTPGGWRGRIRIAPDFDDPLPEGWLEPLEP